MPTSVSCPSCSARLSVPDSAAGRRVKCPKCQAVITVPAVEEDAGFEVVEPAAPARVAHDDEDDDRPARRRSGRRTSSGPRPC